MAHTLLRCRHTHRMAWQLMGVVTKGGARAWYTHLLLLALLGANQHVPAHRPGHTRHTALPHNNKKICCASTAPHTAYMTVARPPSCTPLAGCVVHFISPTASSMHGAKLCSYRQPLQLCTRSSGSSSGLGGYCDCARVGPLPVAATSNAAGTDAPSAFDPCLNLFRPHNTPHTKQSLQQQHRSAWVSIGSAHILQPQQPRKCCAYVHTVRKCDATKQCPCHLLSLVLREVAGVQAGREEHEPSATRGMGAQQQGAG